MVWGTHLSKEKKKAGRQKETVKRGMVYGLTNCKHHVDVYKDCDCETDREKRTRGTRLETGLWSERQWGWESDRVQSWEGECVGECESRTSLLVCQSESVIGTSGPVVPLLAHRLSLSGSRAQGQTYTHTWIAHKETITCLTYWHTHL